jgi:hypothetical protein
MCDGDNISFLISGATQAPKNVRAIKGGLKKKKEVEVGKRQRLGSWGFLSDISDESSADGFCCREARVTGLHSSNTCALLQDPYGHLLRLSFLISKKGVERTYRMLSL